MLLTVKSHQTEAALDDLAAHAPAVDAVVCAQNGVANEPATLRRFARTYGITVMLPSQHLEPGVVVQTCHPVPGILDVGRYPSGTDEVDRRGGRRPALGRVRVGAAGRHHGLEVPQARHQRRRRRRRPCCPTRPTSSGRWSAPSARPCSPRPASPWSATRPTRERRGDLLRRRPDVDGPNSLGQSLARGTPGTEVDFRAGEIVLLGRLHGVPTPANERVQREVHRRMRRPDRDLD